jgi:hypothetical protein
MANGTNRTRLFTCLAFAFVIAGCGGGDDANRLKEVIEQKYGISVIECTIATGPSVGNSEAEARALARWMCRLASPRTDDASGVTDSEWCATGTSDDDFASAYLMFPRSIQESGEPSC